MHIGLIKHLIFDQPDMVFFFIPLELTIHISVILPFPVPTPNLINATYQLNQQNKSSVFSVLQHGTMNLRRILGRSCEILKLIFRATIKGSGVLLPFWWLHLPLKRTFFSWWLVIQCENSSLDTHSQTSHLHILQFNTWNMHAFSISYLAAFMQVSKATVFSQLLGKKKRSLPTVETPKQQI